ncbi:hypothetical protein KP806_07655 [Paenibacillus sp. N4]|uniref:phage tail fiber protein n=1 Tax=Paenibacillus vietnamensis TaxID=2590547 RepID=UPI001CD15747|nr:hypothetical protein [Paenibacillus vietnamensis]MCA0754922.1 hypothetical protein [Paenibacillus vietnamensis]
MPGSISNYGENTALDNLLGGTKYVGLFTDAAGITTDQPAAEATTGNCPGYERQSVTHAAASGGSKATNSAVTFTATGVWATVRYIGVWDAATAGNLLYWARMDVAGAAAEKTLANGEQISIASGALSINLD